MLEKYLHRLLICLVNKHSTPCELFSLGLFYDIEGVHLLTNRYGVSRHEKKIFRALV